MPKATIVGLFDDEDRVHRAEDGLEERGISRKQMKTMNWREVSESWGPEEEEDATDELMRDLEGRGVPRDDARDFAEAVRRGGNLLVTEVEDDTEANDVARYLDQEGAVDLNERRRHWGGETGRTVRGEELRTGEEARVQKAREDIKIGKRDVETGGVRVHKSVEEKQVEEEVHIREESADIER